MKRSTVLIIGGGVAGLAAAALLARRGLGVTLLEKEDKTGGYVTGFRRQGYYFDATGAFLASCQPGGELHRVLAELGLDKKMAFLPIPAIRNIYPEFTLQLDYRNPAAYVASIAEQFPDQAAGLEKYTDLTTRLGREFLDFEQAPWWRKALLPFFYPTLFRSARLSHGAVLDKFFGDNPRIIQALSALPTTLPPSELSYIFVAVLWAKVLKDGVYYPKGGMLALSDGLTDCIRDHGGEICCNRQVVRILQNGPRATGVELADGGRIEADWVIGGCNLFAGQRMLEGGGQLYGRLHNPARFRASTSALLYYVALPPNALPPDWPYFVSLHTGNDPEAEAAALEQGSMEDNLHLVITTPTVLDSGLAPAGHHSLKILAHAPRAGLFAERYRSDADQEALKGRIFDHILRATGLDIKKHAVFVDQATPMTLMRRTGNEEGAMYGLDAACGQVGPQRPPLRTKLDNLLWVGHYSRPAHGIVGSVLSGSFAANIIQPPHTHS